MPILAALIIIAGFVVLLNGFRMFDRLVQTQYDCRRPIWEADGRPGGFFWRAPECTWFSSGRAAQSVLFTWLFTTPLWMADMPDCIEQLRRFRVSVLVWSLMVLTIVGTSLLRLQ